MSCRRIPLLGILFVAISSFICVAQVEQGSITGAVIDQSGASIPKVAISATNMATQVAAKTETNDEGYYKLPYLPPGKYAIVAEKQGFAPARVTDISLMVGSTATINISLKMGSVHEEVTVTASAVLLEQQSSSLGYVAQTQQIIELPTGRSAYSLALLAPGTLPTVGGSPAGTGPIVNGGRSNTSDALVDGQTTLSTTGNDPAYVPPMETVAEFRFITNNFSAEYGRSTNAIVTVASRSGTNQLHGAAYEFLQNNKLNANGWTNNRNGLKINPVRNNQYGIALGGPVYIPHKFDGRDKTFFFVNWEQIDNHSPDNLTATVPTAAQRTGDFSQTLTNSGALIQIYDPLTTVANPSSPGNYIRSQFPGNQIPASRINPISANLLQFYPLPNLPGITNNFVQADTRVSDQFKYYGRVDQNFGDKNRLFFRYGFNLNPAHSGYTGIAFPEEGTSGAYESMRTTGWSTILSDTETLTPNLIGEFRLGYTRYLVTETPRSAGFNLAKLGLPSYLTGQPGATLFPEIDVSGESSIGPQRASWDVDSENTAEWQAHLTWSHGAHAIKGGWDMLIPAFNTFRPDYPAGNFSFSTAFTQGPNPSVASATAGYGIATLLLGAPSGGSFTVGPALAAIQKSYNAYIQDDWKVTRNLTLNIGARWEYQTPWTERHNQLAYFDPNAKDPITGLPGLLSFVNSSNRYQSDPHQTDIAPRLGLAYHFAKDTVFRAGYGWFYAPGSGGIGASPGDLGSGSEASTPVYLGPTQAAPNTPPPGTSLANPFATGLLPYPNTLIGNGIGAVFRDWYTPMNQAWNANIQHTFKDLLVEVAYVGTRGEHIWGNLSIDAANPMYESLGAQLNALVSNPFYGKITSGSLSAATVRQSSLLLPWPQYTGITCTRCSHGDSSYNAVTLRVEKRMSQGLTFQSSYSFGKLIDDIPERFASGGSTTIDVYNLKLSRSVSDNNRAQVWVSNFIYELPFGHGKQFLSKGIAGMILGNWQASGILTVETGTPTVISAPSETQLPGIGSYAVRTTNPNLPSGQRSLNQWFNTAAFAVAPLYTLGTDSRTEPNLFNPGVANLALGLSRFQPIRENMKLQFRAEMYNATNHTNFSAPSNSVTAANFGQITSAAGGRTITLALRLSF